MTPAATATSAPRVKAQASPQQLQTALSRMRQRLVFASWPADLDEAMADPWRARLITLTAKGMAAPQPASAVYRCGRPAALPPMTTQPYADRKRAAAGDFD